MIEMNGVASSMPMHPVTASGAQTTKNRTGAIGGDMRSLNNNGIGETQPMTFYPSADIRASNNSTSNSGIGAKTHQQNLARYNPMLK